MELELLKEDMLLSLEEHNQGISGSPEEGCEIKMQSNREVAAAAPVEPAAISTGAHDLVAEVSLTQGINGAPMMGCSEEIMKQPEPTASAEETEEARAAKQASEQRAREVEEERLRLKQEAKERRLAEEAAEREREELDTAVSGLFALFVDPGVGHTETARMNRAVREFLDAHLMRPWRQQGNSADGDDTGPLSASVRRDVVL